MEYDAIVVGAGPGGSAAAYFLADSGAKVAVLEKKKFPRPKTCGDGLTPRAVRILHDIGLGPELGAYQKVKGLRVRGGGRTLDLDWPKASGFPSYGLVRRRRDLDEDIAGRAMKAGAEYHFATEAVAPITQGARVNGVRWVKKSSAEGGGVEKVDEGGMQAPFVIVADGASSPFGRALGIERNPGFPLGLAIRTYYKSHRHDDDFFESWLELRKGDELLPGYGWLFPVGDGTVNVGVGLLTTFGEWRSVNLNHLQHDFIDMLPASSGISHDSQTEPYKSGRLPMGGSVEKPFGPGYVVIGDAAGMVNPFNGEGIAYALETAKLAAGLIAEQLRSGSSNELLEYREALHDVYGSYYRIGRRFVRIIGKPQAFRALCQVGMRSQTIMEFVFQVLANLGEERGGRLGDRGFRALVRLAERELPDLREPEIPEPPTRPVKKVGAA